MFHKLLLDEPPLVVIPSLATAIGLNEAIVLQQIHYWLQVNTQKRSDTHYHQGRYWTYNTAAEWAKAFPFWGESTIRKIFAGLEKSGIFLKGFFNEKSSDRTKWTTIDYDRLEQILSKKREDSSKSFAQIEQMGSSDLADQTCSDLADLLYTETPTKNNYRENADSDFSLSGTLNFQDPDQTKNLILDQQGEFSEKQEGLDPEKVNSAAPPIFAPQPPENTPLSRLSGQWDINYLNKVWRDNKAAKWKVSSLMFLNSEIQYGLEQFLQRAGGDRAEAYRLIGISIAEMARDEFYGSRPRMLGEVIGLDISKPCKTYCGNWLGAAIDREENAKQKSATIAQTSIAPAIPNHFSGWDT